MAVIIYRSEYDNCSNHRNDHYSTLFLVSTSLFKKWNHFHYCYYLVYIFLISLQVPSVCQFMNNIFNFLHWACLFQIPGRVIPKTFKKWYLILPCLTLSIIRYLSKVKWSNPGKGVVPSPTPWCSRYWKGSLRVTLDYSRHIYFLLDWFQN